MSSSADAGSWRNSWQLVVCNGLPWALATSITFTLWHIHSVQIMVERLKQGKRPGLFDYFLKPLKETLKADWKKILMTYGAMIILQFLLRFLLLRH